MPNWLLLFEGKKNAKQEELRVIIDFCSLPHWLPVFFFVFVLMISH